MAIKIQKEPDMTKAAPAWENLSMRDFQGMNVTSPRHAIQDDQFAWLENMIPIGPGNLAVVPAASAISLTVGTGLYAIYVISTAIAGTQYVFFFLSDGSGFYTDTTFASNTTFAAAATFTNPQACTFATNSGTQGLLIIDPSTGYFDFNLTVGMTLSHLSNAVVGVTIGNAGGNYTAAPAIGFYGGGGSGAAGTAYVGIRSGAITDRGTGYLVNDLLNITGGISTTQALLQVTATDVAGGITSFVIATPGAYTTIPSNNVSISGGAGSGATLSLVWSLFSIVMTASGSGYTSTPTITGLGYSGGSGAVATAVTNSGLTGQAIATYAGRVWVATGKAISYTDIGQFNSFGGAGGQLTINDSYLAGNVTALESNGGFLYIFGPSSIDVLSNVQVGAPGTTLAGVTSFSRTNITTSIGTAYPNSVMAYSRSLMFAGADGFYSLSGATPVRISDDISGLFSPSVFVGGMNAGMITILGEQCIAWSITYKDVFSGLVTSGTQRTGLIAFSRGKWFMLSNWNTPTGAVATEAITTPGTYTVLPTNPVSVTGGTGSGATFNLTWTAGAVTGAVLVAPGSGYTVGDHLTVSGGTHSVAAVVTVASLVLVQVATGPVFSASVGGLFSLYALTGAATDHLYQMGATSSAPQLSFVRTKLWDGGDSLRDKSLTQVGCEMYLSAAITPAMAITGDSENANNAATLGPLPSAANIPGFVKGLTTTSGGKYLGVSIKGQNTNIVFSSIVAQFRAGRSWSG